MTDIDRSHAYALATQQLHAAALASSGITSDTYNQAASILTRDEHFTRRIELTPGWDKRDPDPMKNYGIGGVKITWYLVGPRGGITWEILTSWFPPNVTEEMYEKTGGDRYALKARFGVDGGAVEFHAKRPMHANHEPKPGCMLNGGEPCYFDVAYTIGDKLMQLLIEKGGEEVWKRLEEKYLDLPQDDAEGRT